MVDEKKKYFKKIVISKGKKYTYDYIRIDLCNNKKQNDLSLFENAKKRIEKHTDRPMTDMEFERWILQYIADGHELE